MSSRPMGCMVSSIDSGMTHNNTNCFSIYHAFFTTNYTNCANKLSHGLVLLYSIGRSTRRSWCLQACRRVCSCTAWLWYRRRCIQTCVYAPACSCRRTLSGASSGWRCPHTRIPCACAGRMRHILSPLSCGPARRRSPCCRDRESWSQPWCSTP